MRRANMEQLQPVIERLPERKIQDDIEILEFRLAKLCEKVKYIVHKKDYSEKTKRKAELL